MMTKDDLTAWCKKLVHGAGGLRAYFAREVKRRATLEDAVAFTLRSLGNPRCDGAGDVLAAIHAARGDVAHAGRLRPMSEAPTSGPVVEVLVATTDRAGCRGWLIAHYAYGGGEDQPRFRGWFFWTGHDFRQIDERTLLGWIPLPVTS